MKTIYDLYKKASNTPVKVLKIIWHLHDFLKLYYGLTSNAMQIAALKITT